MKPRLIIIFLLLVLSPLALLAWLGWRATTDEQARIRTTISEAHTNQLVSLRSLIHETITAREREFSTLLNPELASNPTRIRDILRRQRFARQIFITTADGKFIHPPANPDLRTESEKQFFERTDSIWKSGEKFFTTTTDSNSITLTTDLNSQAEENYGNPAWAQQLRAVANTADAYTQAEPPKNFTTDQGWHTWFHGDGAQMIYWLHSPATGLTLGVELDREAIMAEVIAKLPSDTGAGTGSIVLTDASARPIYQWGELEPAADEAPDVSIPLFPPLSMWHLNHYAQAIETSQLSTANILGLVSGTIAAAVALLALAIYFYRENSREMRAASEQVSFVNQVSHELKTPLTNIRMYAELAEEKLPENDTGASRCLDIVVNESQRLSRLISNVLTFAKPKAQQPNPTTQIPDKLIRETLDHFRPALEAQKIDIELKADATEAMQLDADFLGQILGNLLSNVEKYAASGKKLTVSSSQQNGKLSIQVTDHGPGIPKSQREKIFTPFHRLSNRNSDGVSGTGIGLTIARDLARLHGGDLTLSKDTPGCTFILTMNDEV